MLRILAVTAPHWIRKQNGISQISLNSLEPFSLENAIRYAAFKSIKGQDEWGKSNWKDELKKSIMMYEYFENQKDEYIRKLNTIRPNLILIGTMTLGFAGAIQIALLAKKILGDSVTIVLGGKHIIETTYLDQGEISSNKNCTLSLMKNGVIPKVFDLVVSGDGEEIIVEIGNIISLSKDKNVDFSSNKKQMIKARGKWVVGWLNKNEIDFIKSENEFLDYHNIPFPLELFEPKSNFPVFDADLTAHIYSYLSKGCPYDCFFCSEKSSINGKLQNQNSGPLNLITQLKLLQSYGTNNGYKKLSAFIEDSIILGGSKKLLKDFVEELKKEELQIKIGGQLTIDLLLNNEYQKIVSELAKNGLNYLFIGLETNIDNIASKMSKNTNKKSDWIERTEEVIMFLFENKIKLGFSVLFGLGEEHVDRMNLLDKIYLWQQKYKMPEVISLNIATKHPLMQETEIAYKDWGTSYDSPFLDIFLELFGEASELYCYNNNILNSIDNLYQLRNKYLQLQIKN